MKVRSGYLPTDRQGASSAAARDADKEQVLEWCTGAGVGDASNLWTRPPALAAAAGSHPGTRTFVLDLNSGTDAASLVERLSGQPWVEYAEINRLFTLHEIPNDPLFDRQWHLENSGQPYWRVASVPGENNDTLAEAVGTPGADVGFLSAYDHPGPKADVLVAVLDSGVDADHEDLHDCYAINGGEIPDNGLDDDHNGFVDDVYGWDFSGDVLATPSTLLEDNDISDFLGHGTHVAGTIAATTNNGIGIAGVADRALVFGVKIFPNPFFSVSAQAVYYAVSRGARVINMSWGGEFRSRALDDALTFAHARGVVLVGSSGNSGREQVFYPSSYPQTISVGSSHSRDGLSGFSTYNGFIDLVAPGQHILSLRGEGTDLFAGLGEAGSHIVNDKYLISSGTSMAAPHVSGAAAALLSIAPGLSNERVREILRASAHDITDPFDEGAGYPGWDRFTGAGRLDLEAAITHLPGVHVLISAPPRDAWVGGELTIAGRATGSAFQGFEIRVASGHTPADSEWVTVSSSANPVDQGNLGTWDTEPFAGPYTIRLDAGPDAQFDVPVTLVQGATARLIDSSPSDTVHLLKAIMGTAAAHDFESYSLEAVGPLPANTSHPITTSAQPVWDDTLALWRTESLPAGAYRLILTVETLSGSVRDSGVVVVSNAFATGWPVTLPGVVHFAISTVNLDGVGDDEIICPTQRGLWVFRSDGTVYPGWPRDTTDNLTTSTAIADLDHDGKFELIVAGVEKMYVYAFIGEQYEGWPRPFSSIGGIYGRSLPVVGNIDGRGPLEIAAIDRFGRIRVWNADGSDYIPEGGGSFGEISIAHSSGNSLPAVTICDLDRDGRPELIAAGDGIHIFDGRTAGPFHGNAATRVAAHYSINGLVVGDFDSDHIRDIAYAATDSPGDDSFISVHVITASGSLLPGWPRLLPQTLKLNLLYSLTAGDIDADRSPELFVAPSSLGEGILYGFHANGSPVGSDSTDGRLATFRGAMSAVGLVDLDRDDEPEIVFRVGKILSGPDQIIALKVDGSMVPGYPIDFGFGATFAPATPIIGDINHDGFADMVTVQSTDKVVAVWKLGTPISFGARPWPQFRGDRWNSGVAATPRYDVVHLMRLLNVLFRNAPSLPPYEPSDLDCNGNLDVADAARLVDYLFRDGPEPCVR